jgi:hypothetical protein
LMTAKVPAPLAGIDERENLSYINIIP